MWIRGHAVVSCVVDVVSGAFVKPLNALCLLPPWVGSELDVAQRQMPTALMLLVTAARPQHQVWQVAAAAAATLLTTQHMATRWKAGGRSLWPHHITCQQHTHIPTLVVQHTVFFTQAWTRGICHMPESGISALPLRLHFA